MNDSLSYLTDRLLLRELVDRYAVGMDQRNSTAVAELFTEDARMVINEGGIESDIPTQEVLGGRQIAAGADRLAEYETTMHFVGQHLVEIDAPDHATGITYCIAHHVSAGEHGRVDFVVNLRYLDEYTRVGDRWLFRERRLSFNWVEHRPIA